MKKLFAVASFVGGFLLVFLGHAADLKQSKFTQVVNDVEVISSANNLEKPATVNEIFNMPDLVRTGEASRAELVAEDKTITRVGANTIFSFDSANRTIDLQQGSLLFHSPKGMGGGTIRTSSATASVLGTTLIVTTTHSGGFKVIDLEGHVAIKFLGGVRQDLNPGQMTFVLAGGHPAPVLTIRLDTLTKDSHLVQGFDAPLPSMPLIQQQVDDQVKEIQSGQAQDTGLLVGDEATSKSVQTVTQVDPNTIPAARASNGPPDSVIIDTPTLDSAFITSFSDASGPTTEFLAPAATPNIFINTPTINLGSYTILSSSFAFIAPGMLTINSSVAFNGLPTNASSKLELFAGTQLSIASGSTVEADVGFFILRANGSSGVTFNGVNFVNTDPSGDILIQAPNGSVTLNNPSLNTGSLGISAGGSVTVIQGSHGNGNFQVNNVFVQAGDGILADGGDPSPSLMMGAAKPGIIDMTAANLLTAQNLKLDSMTVNLTANTINLMNVAFANNSAVTLKSLNGQLNVGPSQANYVNFISNVTYGGQPAENFVPTAQGGKGLGSGIIVTTRP